MRIDALPLSAITRISPLNPRQDAESDVSSLAATISACGLVDPLVVWPRPDAPGEYEVLSGGRRWRALRQLADDDRAIAVDIHDGDAASALRIALAVAVTPRPQHPVDEYEAFAKLVAAGMSVAQIARDFGETEKRVNQRLALAALSPRVRGLWRAGRISAESAQAYTVGGVEAQDALLDQCGDDRHRIDNPLTIRRALRGDVMREDDPVSRFILSDGARVQAYVEAGGRVAGDLFTAGALRDAPIAEKVAAELLRAEAERVAQAEGWARGLIEDDGAWGDEDDLDFTEEEHARLDEIEGALHSDPAPENADALIAEQEQIAQDAMLRQWPADARGKLGVMAALDFNGKMFLSRGLALPDAAAEAAGDRTPAHEPGEATPPSASPGESGEHHDDDHDQHHDEAPAPDPFADPGKALRAVIDETATASLAATLRRRPDIALAVAVAALGCCYGVTGVALRPVAGRTTGDAEEANGLLRAISGEHFEDALARCAGAPTGDLTVAFARLMALAVNTQGASLQTIAAMIGAAGTRGANMTGALFDALDRRSYFEAIGKARSLDAIGAMIGEGEAKTHRNKPKDKVTEAAAHIALDRKFLPAPFANWAAVAAAPYAAADAIHASDERPIDATPLADAMAGAIAADEATKSVEARALDAKIDEVAAAHAAPLLVTFLRERVHFGNEALDAGQVKAGDLYDAYVEFVGQGKPLAQREFGDAIAAIGVAKKRKKTGWHYLNIALRDPSKVGETS